MSMWRTRLIMPPRKKKDHMDDDAVYTDILSIKYNFKPELNLPQPDVEARVAKQQCDYKCKKKCENVKLVRLYDITIEKDHGYSSLCDDAILKTLSSGITVFIENPPSQFQKNYYSAIKRQWKMGTV